MSQQLLINKDKLQEALTILQSKATASGGLDTTDATATSADILSGKTAYVKGQKITGNIAFAPAKIITPTTTSQVAISSGYYASGAITVAGDSNLVAENIKKGTTIFGVSGSYEASGGSSGTEVEYSANEDDILEGELTTYTNDRITKLKDYVFAYDCELTSVNFPACTNIGSNTFSCCINLTSINFPVCTKIGDRAFYSCTGLTSANFPLCTNIGTYAFYECYNLTSINFPVCAKIGGDAFGQCSKLTSINFPACIYIASDAFYDCSNLTSINFPVCKTIERTAFYNCTKLTSINFPACTKIGYWAFSSCTGLTSANFPVCTNIGASAFAGCSKLTSLTLGASSVASLANVNAFGSTPISVSTYTGSFGSIYVPASLVDAYKSATNWATYADRITAISTGGAD